MAIPGVRNFGSHIGRAEVADEVVGPNFTELWISLDPSVDYDATVAKVQAVVDGYPGPQARPADLPARADQGSAHRRERHGRRPHLRSGDRAAPVARRGGEEGARGRSGHDRHPGAVAGAGAAGRSAVSAGPGGAVRPDARRRAARGDDAGAGHEGRRVLRSAARLRRRRARRAGAPQQPRSDSRAARAGRRAARMCRSARSRGSRWRRRSAR